MRVCHCLFRLEDHRITAVLNNGKKPEIIKFGGYDSVEYKDDFWESWQDYAGFLKDDLTDFCFVYDTECPQLSEHLKGRECAENECLWDKYSIKNAIDILGLHKPTLIFNENGVCIARAGSFRNADDTDAVRLTAVYRSCEKEPLADETDIEEEPELTPFIEDMLFMLKKYDEEK